MKMKLTAAFVETVKSPQSGRMEYFDRMLPAFALRLTSTGHRSWIIVYRIAGRTRRMTLGSYPALSLAEAREAARKAMKEITEGNDPAEARERKIQAPTVADLARDYLERHASRKRTGDADRRMLDRSILPRLGRKKVAVVTHRDIEDIHRAMAATPFQANRVVALASKMFSLAVKWGWRADNPARGIERNPEDRRERFLSGDEIARLTEALRQYEADAHRRKEAEAACNAVRLLVLTGARRGEVLSARWNDVDLGAGVWTKPSAHTKSKKEHRVPLSPPALQLLHEMHAARRDAGYLFPARSGNVGHLTEIKKAWAAVRKLAGLGDVRLHDLRHSFASILVSGGASLPLIGALLGHTQPGTTARYAHLFDEPLREAAAKVGAVYQKASNGAGKVVPIRRKG